MITNISEIYAQSLLNFDFDVLTQLKQIQEVLTQSDDLQNVLNNPSVNIKTKIDILQSVFSSKIDDRLVNFLKILCENNRINEFSQIVSNFEIELDKKNNIKSVEIISAIEVSENYKQKIIEKLGQKLQSTIHPQWSINPEIIGGLIYKYDDTVIDSSLKKKIENLSKTIK